MAIQDYVSSRMSAATISKADMIRFLDLQVARADRDQDGRLDPDEMALFVYLVSTPERDKR